MSGKENLKNFTLLLRDGNSGEDFSVTYTEDGTYIGTEKGTDLNTLAEVLKVTGAFEDLIRILNEAKNQGSGEKLTTEDINKIIEMIMEFRRNNACND